MSNLVLSLKSDTYSLFVYLFIYIQIIDFTQVNAFIMTSYLMFYFLRKIGFYRPLT